VTNSTSRAVLTRPAHCAWPRRCHKAMISPNGCRLAKPGNQQTRAYRPGLLMRASLPCGWLALIFPASRRLPSLTRIARWASFQASSFGGNARSVSIRSNGMRLSLFVTAMVALGLAGWNFNAVLEELRRSLPPQFGELNLRTAVGYHIWTPAASDTARWRYVWSHLWASLFALLMGILLWLWDAKIAKKKNKLVRKAKARGDGRQAFRQRPAQTGS